MQLIFKTELLICQSKDNLDGNFVWLNPSFRPRNVEMLVCLGTRILSVDSKSEDSLFRETTASWMPFNSEHVLICAQFYLPEMGHCVMKL